MTSASVPTPSAPSAPPTSAPLPTPTAGLPHTALHISLIRAAAFVCACALPGSAQFRMHLCPEDMKLRASSMPSAPPDLSVVPSDYHEFTDVFSKAKATELPLHHSFNLNIDLEEGASLPLGTVYSLSPPELEVLRTFIDEHLSYGFIKQSTSTHGAPVLFVKKKDGSLRLCVDYRGLNKITKKDCYLLPLISDLLDSPSHAKIYSKIDLCHAYHLVQIGAGDEWKTAFRTRYGSYEWLVTPFGLTNAPAAFQQFVNSIFADMLDVCIVVYLDDILIYSHNKELHCQHIKEVLCQHSLFAKPEKCEFHKDSVEYLSYVLSPSGLTMSADKVQSIHDWPEPRKVKDIQSFLGFVNFYHQFIGNYSDIVVPLTRLTWKGTPWSFSEECRSAFLHLKTAFTSTPILTHWVPDAPVTVETDTLDYAIAGILLITCSDGELRPVAFYSCTLTAPELNYDTHDKELLAIFEAFCHWRHYLEGSATPADMVTDHKNLEYFSTSKVLTCHQAHWSEYLSQFNLAIHFHPGHLGTKPDALTRCWDVYPKEGDKDYAQVNPHNLCPVFTQEQFASSLHTTHHLAPVLRAAMIFDVEQLHADIISALPSDPISTSHLPTLTDLCWSLDHEGLLCLNGHIFVPDIDGHFGQSRTVELVRHKYVWPNLCTDVKNYVRSCTTCGRSKVPHHRPFGLLKQLPVPEKPWNSISMDFIEHLPNSAGYSAILVVVDCLSKQTMFIPTHDSITSTDLAKLFLTHIFSKHGVPAHVTSDRGPEFMSHFFRSLGKALDMCLHFTLGYHPEGDGQTERMNQTLEQYLCTYCNYQQDNWSELLPLAEFACNNVLSATTGVSPFFANKGYHPNLSVYSDHDLTSLKAHNYVVELSALHDFLRTEMAAAQLCYQGLADARRILPPEFKVGDQAYVKARYFCSTCPSAKLAEKNLGPYAIIARPGTHSITLCLPDAMRAIHPVFHVSQLEPATPNPFPDRHQPPPPPVEVDDDLEYEILEILDSKVDCRCCHCQLLYLVCWAGYENTEDETSWVLATELEHASKLLAAYHACYPHKPGPYSPLS
ncbi:hypothetical protein M404DRAFT_30984 [Pisolithus tinctorius Marx 270]|uniref:Reverse transcriptase n=1 Tax=Pisolithus tinctorius Marx 270 TaxID=870435 RepID=A0A0C3NUG4_PISTI|nr:hypothetical protein M404DRAFT_30984 [Pisolithus tinctorius Marx 270]